MSKLNYLKKIFINGGFFILLLVITFYLIFRHQNIGEIIHTVTKVNPVCIIIAVGCMCMFVFCEAVNIGRTLRIYSYNTSLAKCVKYALAGFFFSAITPMASGSQPAQIYYMYRDGIEISHSALALMMELGSFQLITVVMAVLAYIAKFSFFSAAGYQIKYILLVGVILNTLILVIILMAFFSKSLLQKCINGILLLLKNLHYKKIEQKRAKINNQVELYHEGAAAFKNHKITVLKIILTTFLQVVAFHSIPFWIYKAFGYNEYHFLTVLAIQAVLYITASAIPVPGSVGASESGFILVYRTLFPAQVLNSAMLLSRGISFYLFVCISGIFLLIFHIVNRGSHMDYKKAAILKNKETV